MLKREKELKVLRELVKKTGREKLTTNVLNILEEESADCSSVIELMEQVRQYRCISGLIGALITYAQIEQFYGENMIEIFDLFYEECGEHGFIPISVDLDNKASSLSWYAFESTTSTLLQLYYDRVDN